VNKLVIPAILVATVMVAGIFAFSPIDEASTVHTQLVGDIAGASAIVTSETVTTTTNGVDQFDEFHYVIMESGVAFTIKDIEIESTMAAAIDDGGDSMRLDTVRAFAGEYASTVAGIDSASDDDTNWGLLCGDCNFAMNRGNDALNTITTSLRAHENDDSSADNWSFGPNTKIFVQIEHVENGNEAGDLSSTVTFYLSGPVASDITITEFENQEGQ